MSPIEMLAHLRETVGQMLSILDSRSTAASPEFDILRQYNQRLLDFDVSSASPATIEARDRVLFSAPAISFIEQSGDRRILCDVRRCLSKAC